MDGPGRAPSPAPEVLLAEAAAGLCLSPPRTPPGDPGGDERGGGCPAPLEQELAALGLPPGGGPRALGGLLRLYREAAAGGARRERELRGLRQRLGLLQGRVGACARAMAAAGAEAERLREQNRRLRELLAAERDKHRPTAQPHREPRGSMAQRRPRHRATELPSAAPRGGAAGRAPRVAQRQQGSRQGSDPPGPPRNTPSPRGDPDPQQELQRLREEAAAGRELIALQHRCLQEAMVAALAPPGTPPPGLAEERGRLRRLQGALARERRAFTQAAERLVKEQEQFEAERAALLRQHFLSTPDPWDPPEMWGTPPDPWDPPEMWGTPPDPWDPPEMWGTPPDPWDTPEMWGTPPDPWDTPQGGGSPKTQP